VNLRTIYDACDVILTRCIDFYGIRNPGRANDATGFEGGRINDTRLGALEAFLFAFPLGWLYPFAHEVSSVVSIRLDGLVY